jgi:hypothetical protein
MAKKNTDKSGRFEAEHEPTPCVIAARFTELEKAAITREADLHGLTLSEFLRMAVISWLNER